MAFPVWGNPTGAQVINGAVSIQQSGSTLNVTNAPGAIINWQGFSIGAQEITRFLQQSGTSAVLNRVVGGDISQIAGQLLSNGRVFLINPSGILIGPGAVIDTAGFVGSTLNMLDADFLAGKLKFQGDASSGPIINQGWIRTGHGGQVILVAPHIENSGLIETPSGELLLAAGQKITITSLDSEGVQFEIQAPTDTVLNVGKLIAQGGAVGVFAGTLRHSGEIRADALVQDAAGRIVLKAQNELQIAAGSTISADGAKGGSITLEAGQGHARVAGQISAQGSAGQGGDIQVLGERVSIVESAELNTSGSAGGGQILVGGDFQGNNPAIQNASNVFVGANATLRADATQAGDGGRVIVWSDDKAQFYGSLSARGGPQAGNGGFAEVSGKQNLIFAGNADLGAPNGNLGTLLLDPLDLYVFSGGGVVPSIIDESTDFPTNAATVSPATLAAINGNINLFASRYMRISDPINLTTPGQSLTATVGVYTPPVAPDPLALSTSTVFNELEIGADITTAGGAVSLIAPTIQSVATSTISTSGGAITLNSSGSTIQASQLSLNAGSGAVTATSGSFLQLNAVTGGSFTATAPSFMQIFGAITTSGPVSLISTANFVSTFGGITAGTGSVSLTGTSVSGVSIDTTGSVALTATAGSVNTTTVNNSSSLTALATGSVTINSTTNLNVATVSAGGFGTASLTSTGGAILPTSPASQVTGRDVSLTSTDTGSGGGIGSPGTALNVDVQRQLTFTTNAGYNVLLNGSGPYRLNATLNPAHATTGSYSGTMSKQGGGLTMNASADTTTVTLSDLSITSGFDQAFDSSISFITSGNLIANNVVVPIGNTAFPANPNQLPVSLTASGDLTLDAFTRAAGVTTNNTTIRSFGGTVKLGAVDGNNDNVTIRADSGSVLASADNPSLEVTTAGTLSIISATGIGNSLSFTNPLDLAGSTITLTSNGGGAIGDAGPVITNTQNLIINAGSGSTFNVSTGAVDIKNLTVTADRSSVGTGLAQVSSNSALYNFNSNPGIAGSFELNLNGGVVPPEQFAGGTLSFTSTAADIELAAGDVNMGATGSLALTSFGGSITNGADTITAANVTLTAAGSIDTDSGNITATAGNIEIKANTSVLTGDLNATGSLTIDFQCCSFPTVSVGDIGATTPPSAITINGSTVDTGAVIGAGNITLNAFGGLLNLGSGTVTTANGSTINLFSSDVTPFLFTDINAGATGTVNITSSNGITQSGVGGITAGTVSLLADSGDILKTGNLPLALTSTSKLTLDADGDIRITATGTALTELAVTERASLDSATIDLTLFGTQSVAFTGGSTDFGVAVNSPTALKFTLVNAAGGDISLTGSGIATSGGSVTLTSQSGSINTETGGISTTGGTGGSVTLTANGGGIVNGTPGIVTDGGGVTMTAAGTVNTGVITTSGGNINITTDAGNSDINVNGDLSAGNGTVSLSTLGADSYIVNPGLATSVISSSTVVNLLSLDGNIGEDGAEMLITSPSVILDSRDPFDDGYGQVFATLTGTSTLNLRADTAFNVTSDMALNTLTLTTASIANTSNDTVLTAPGQTYTFARPATGTFQIVEISGPTTATISLAETNSVAGILLVEGISAIPSPLNVANLTLSTSGGADINLQGTAADPLSLSNTTQSFSASGDLNISGKVTLTATNSQSFTAAGSIIANADTANVGGGGILITAPNQTFITTGASSTMKFLGGSAANEKVEVSASNSQLFDANTSFNLPDMLLLEGGSGAGSSVTLSYSGTGLQQFQIQNGMMTVKGGTGANAFAKVDSASANQQQICRNVPFVGCVGSVGTLNILGGSGDGAFAQMTASGSQFIRAGSTNVTAGSGDGANALLQAATSQQIIGGGGSNTFTVEGKGSAGKTATAQVLAGDTQSISSAGNILVKAGNFAGSLARIAATSTQTISGTSLTLSAGGAGSTSGPAVPNASAIIEGNNQSITSFGALSLNGGFGTTGNTSDAVIRNLSGGQTVFASGLMTLTGGHEASTTGILNLGTGSQTVTGSGGILLRSDISFPPASADAFVLIQNQPATLQTINATSGGVTLINSGAGTVGVTSAGTQNVTARYVDVSTSAGSTGNATISAVGNQRIHTTNGTSGPNGSMRVAALGSGTASIESGASQLLEIDYPELMQVLGEPGTLVIGDAAAVGNSLIQAVDQSVFAGTITLTAGSGAGSLSKLSASNTQTISTLLGGLDILGGSGANSLATVDPVTQIILINGNIFLVGGAGPGADASIVSAGSQVILATNGDISLTGGSGSGSDAFITAAGNPQTIIASGTVILLPTIGNAFISGPPTANILAFDTTSLILPLQEDQTSVLGDIVLGEDGEPLIRRGIPICR